MISSFVVTVLASRSSTLDTSSSASLRSAVISPKAVCSSILSWPSSSAFSFVISISFCAFFAAALSCSKSAASFSATFSLSRNAVVLSDKASLCRWISSVLRSSAFASFLLFTFCASSLSCTWLSSSAFASALAISACAVSAAIFSCSRAAESFSAASSLFRNAFML